MSCVQNLIVYDLFVFASVSVDLNTVTIPPNSTPNKSLGKIA